MPVAPRVRIVVGEGSDARTIQGFESYRVRQDLRQMAASFVLTMKPAPSKADFDLIFGYNRRVTIEVDGTPQIVGRCDSFSMRDTRTGGSALTITGADLLGQPARCSLPLGFSVSGLTIQQTIAAALRDACLDVGGEELEIIGSNDANRDTIGRRMRREPIPVDPGEYDEWYVGEPPGWDESPATGHLAHGRAGERAGERQWDRVWDPSTDSYIPRYAPHGYRTITLTDRDDRQLTPMPGELVGQFIARVCEHHRLLCLLSADGQVILTRPRTDQAVLMRLHRGGAMDTGAIVASGWDWKPGDQVARQTVCGRVSRRGETKVFVTETDDDLVGRGWKLSRTEVDDGLRDTEKATNKAIRLMRDAQLGSWEYTCTLSGHAVGGCLPGVDMLYEVTDPRRGLEGEVLYCIARDFSRSRSGGTSVDLTLVRPGTLLT